MSRVALVLWAMVAAVPPWAGPVASGALINGEAASLRASEPTTRHIVKLLCSFEPEELVRIGGKGYDAKPSDNLFNARPPDIPIAGVTVGNGPTGW